MTLILTPLKALSASELNDFLVTKGWLSLTGLHKLEELAGGDLNAMTDIISTLDATLSEELIQSVDDLISEKFSAPDLLSATVTLLDAGEGRLDRFIDELYEHSSSITSLNSAHDSVHLATVFELNPTPDMLDHSSYDGHADLIDDRYMITGRLGEGGMCYVDRAYDVRLGREVALKRLKDNQLKNSDACSHFEIEARVMGRLAHPNLLPVYDFIDSSQGESQGYTMRVIPYPTLYDLVREGPQLSQHQLCGILRQVALALESAHTQGVVHRDVKPHNILIGSGGEVYLTDWGVCSLSEHHPDAHLMSDKSAYSLVGTPAFMAPEQVECDVKLISPRTDVYGLGVTLYYALTGKVPYRGEGLVELVRRIGRDDVVIPSALAMRAGRLRVPPELDQICLKAMSKRPQNRYQSARDFAHALDAFLSGETEKERKLLALTKALERGHLAKTRYEDLRQKQANLKEEIALLSAQIGPPREGDDLKITRARRAPLWSLEEELDSILSPIEESFTQASSAYQTALGVLSKEERVDHLLAQEAKISLSNLLWGRFLEAEKKGDMREVAHLEERLRMVATDEVLTKLDGVCEVALHELPEEVTLEVYQETLQRYHVTSSYIKTAQTPLDVALHLPPGVYLIKLSHPQASPCALHIKLKRGDAITLKPRLLKAGELPSGSVYIPDIDGGMGVVHMRHLVRYRDYVRYLNHLGDGAEERAPRYGGTLYAERGSDGRFVENFTDAEGDQWSPDWPVMLVNAHDFEAYATWLATQDEVPWRLPTVDEWRQGAQGADGRPYPWGLNFDSALCLMRDSMRGRVTPSPVGSVESDRSPYGLYDVAGNVCQWTSSKVEGDQEVYRVVGSSFNSVSATCHLDAELSSPPGECMMHIGARLVFTPHPDQLLEPSS